MNGAEIEQHLAACGIAPQSTELRGRPVVKLAFLPDLALQQIIKKEGGAWSKTLGAWYVDRNKTLLVRLVKQVAGARGICIERAEVSALRRHARLKGYSPNTERSYAQLLEQYLDYHYPRRPEELSKAETEDYLLALQAKGLGESSIHTAINAIKFYLEQVVGSGRMEYELPRPKKPLKVVAVFAAEEVAAMIKVVKNLKHRTALVLCYSGGLRVSEVCSLRVHDIDSKRMIIMVREGKGKKDRIVPLSPTTLRYLREYYVAYSPKGFLFGGQDGKSAWSTRSLQTVFGRAKTAARVNKPGSIHALRHSYATHLLDKGTDITYIQKILGHSDLKTTLRYLHVTTRDLHKIISPIEDLGL